MNPYLRFAWVVLIALFAVAGCSPGSGLPEIAANRTQLAALTATNILGQNTPAIAMTEAQYGEMWAQDATAMYSYAGSSAAASRVTPFTAPPSTTNPAGAASQRCVSDVEVVSVLIPRSTAQDARAVPNERMSGHRSAGDF